ncbi:MAG: amidase [Cyclobacteriaceae bacterium]|nr:amidase [Cyclobacteriaceae bacterium]
MHRIIFAVTLVLLFAGNVAAQDVRYPTAPMEPYYDLKFTDTERDSMQSQLDEMRQEIRAIHSYSLDNSVSPSLSFNPYPPGFVADSIQEQIVWDLPTGVSVPKDRNALAFMPVYQLAELIRTRKVTSTELTELYLDRLEKYGDTLKCIVTVLRPQALERARQADAEIGAGKYRGPLHGIPYGIKDLLAVKGTRTTWGAMPYMQQHIDETATVVEKLDRAGAVLVAKLSMGSLAMGDVWFGGKTRNPWNLEQGSSGSSAGSAAATAAGLVAFSIGTETWGSIVSPSTRCGTTGLRPTYGLVSRHGAMALSWSMDKIGPICRSALDCALVFDAIRGPDGKDGTVAWAPFNYNARKPVRELKVGYIKSYFDADTVNRQKNEAILEVVRKLGIEPVEVKLPEKIPVSALSIILVAEAAAAFDELTRSDRDSLLVRQDKNAWPNYFRSARFIPAVEYINALRIRDILIRQYHEATKEFDVIITPSFGGNQLLMTNLTGHPCLVLPHGFNEKGSPVSISLLGKLQGEAALITLGRALQEATPWEDQHPPLFK